MKFNLYWLAVKQVRIGHWLHDKLFLIGLALHVRKKYGKWNPSVLDIIKEQGSYIPKGTKERLGFGVNAIRDGDLTIEAGHEPLSIKSRIRYGLSIAQDVVDGKFDHDKALFDQYFSKLQADFEQIKKEIK